MANGLNRPHTVKIGEPCVCDLCKVEQPAGTKMTLVYLDYYTAEEDWACPKCMEEPGEKK